MESLQSVVKFGVTLANSVDKALADNKIDLLDLPTFMAPLMQAGSAIGSFKGAIEEYKSASPEEKAELIAKIKQDFDLKSERTEEIIEKSLGLALEISELVKAIKA